MTVTGNTRPVLFIDNLDSFTFNLVESFERLGARVRVLRNTADPHAVLDTALKEDALIVLSPGPGAPQDAGCCPALIDLARGTAPVFGVCLGHQAIGLVSGAEVGRAPLPVHGKGHRVTHDGQGMMAGVRNPLSVGRYHSLCVREVPARFTVHADLEGMAMAMSDTEARQYGVQFHPESILTPQGDILLKNILEQA